MINLLRSKEKTVIYENNPKSRQEVTAEIVNSGIKTHKLVLCDSSNHLYGCY